jgi:hypothetical protein
MAFRLFKNSDLIAGVFVFGFMAVLFLVVTAFVHKFAGHIVWNGVVVPDTDPTYGQKVMVWRFAMFGSSLFCAVLGWLCYRGSRRVSDG